MFAFSSCLIEEQLLIYVLPISSARFGEKFSPLLKTRGKEAVINVIAFPLVPRIVQKKMAVNKNELLLRPALLQGASPALQSL